MIDETHKRTGLGDAAFTLMHDGIMRVSVPMSSIRVKTELYPLKFMSVAI